MPSPVEALPCGSRSTISTFSPTAASAVPRLIAVVVLPTPPFWLATTRTRRPPLFLEKGSDLAGTTQPFHAHDAASRVTERWYDIRLVFPISCGRPHVSHNILPLEEQPLRARR